MGNLPVRGLLVVAVALIAPIASAQPKKQPTRPPVVSMLGVRVSTTITPPEGLIEVAIADDGAGQLAYVVADAATQADLFVIDITTNTELRSFDISGLTAAPERIWFVGQGTEASLFVVGRALEGDGMVGALFDPDGMQAKRFGPADAISLIERKGVSQVVVRKVSPAKKGGDVHQLEVFELTKKGKRIGKARKLTLVNGRDDKLGFKFNHWAEDWTVAVGIRDGEYTKKANSRSTDGEGRYDMLTGKMARVEIADLVDHHKRFEVLAQQSAAGGTPVFARVTEDSTGVQVWRDERPVLVDLDQPFELYEPSSLTWAIDDDGSMWIGLHVDPWNRPAVDRKKADPEYFDIFHVDTAGRSTRTGRVLAAKKKLTIGVTAGKVWTLERNVGFDRGGKTLTIYEIEKSL